MSVGVQAIRAGKSVCCGCVVVAVALFGAAGLAYGQDDDPDTGQPSINKRIDDWDGRPPTDAEKETFKSAKTIDVPFPSAYKSALRWVLQWKIAQLAKAMGEGLADQGRPGEERDAGEIRNLWRREILDDLNGAPAEQFRREACQILCPILADIMTGYLDSAGQPDKVTRASAAMILVGIHGSNAAKVDAMLGLLKGGAIDQGTRFMIINELGQARIAKAVPDLARSLKHRNHVLQAAAARALGRIADVDALQPLLDHLQQTGDTGFTKGDDAREALIAAINGIAAIATANAIEERTNATVVAALMRLVLADPDRRVVAAAANAVGRVTQYTETFNVRDAEDLFQQKIERMRRWWLNQRFANEYYRDFFHIETVK